MFTDSEVILMHHHQRDVSNVVSEAQAIIDRQAAQIASLQRALAAERRKTTSLEAERGSRNAAMIAERIGRRAH